MSRADTCAQHHGCPCLLQRLDVFQTVLQLALWWIDNDRRAPHRTILVAALRACLTDAPTIAPETVEET